MEAIDFKKTFKSYYSPKPGQPELLTIPKLHFLMVDGQGDPNTSETFQNAISALYGVAYGLKFSRKKAGLQPDFSIAPLEGLWWTKSGKAFSVGKKQDWQWTVMLWMPNFISAKDVQNQVKVLQAKKPNPALALLRLGDFSEGISVQIMHIGPYSEERPNIELMNHYAELHGYTQSGKHHEIYLGDPRRSAPDKLRTILRHPITHKQ